ncbi:diaminopimelate decarboxylase [Candidatus Hamiltonella endosymbiont of Tuberolachnus salignus]|uniref:diaminopimelate decarboxylase n=1 Tax=Candidatus Williamhamiltonella endosymbiont of Tuberolachnus salignus TaxID=3077954 RepID=UPI0030CB1E00
MSLFLNDSFPPIKNDQFLFILKKFKSPIWIYHSDTIIEKIKKLSLFDSIRFAQKACSNIHILKLMREQNVKVDAVSLGEIEKALKANFIPGEASSDIIFTADLLDKMTLKKVIQLNIPVNAGSIDMLEQIGQSVSGHPVWIRINPGFGHGHHKKTNTGGENSKHGIWHEDLPKALEKIAQYQLKLIGFHMHIGSGVNYQHLKKVCDAMVEQVIKLNQDISAISAGGGLSVPYKKGEKEVDTEHYYNLWHRARKKISKHFGHPISLEIEPGRFLVAESGVLIAQIRAIKNMGNQHYIIVDAGFNDLMRPAMYGSYHRISLLPADGRDVSKEKNIKTVVAGPLCESGDVFTQNQNACLETRYLPPAFVDDYLIFHNTGAYGASMSSNYNSRPLIPEVLLKNGEVQLIRRRQTIEELISLELF